MRACANCASDIPGDARFCPACGTEAGPAAEEERKLATVLFADLVGSTARAGSEDPERVRAMLDRFYDAMAAEIVAAGGTVEKFAGDAVMAAFGAPAAFEDHAERALHAALSMQRRLAALFHGQLGIRIGVNTGDVVVGRPRMGSSFVSGDAVNVAARLEQAAEPGAVLVGERTVRAARGAFEFGPPRMAAAKGKPEGIACRPLVRAISLMRPRGVHGLREAFVGRAGELARLEAAYDAVVEGGRPMLVTILGDAGLGKTRLARELWLRLADRDPEPVRRTGRCLPYGRGITYWALGEVLREQLGVLETDEPAEVLRRLSGREILGLALGLDTAHDLHPLAARDRLHEAWIAFLDEVVADRPATLLLEDLHWAEPPLLDLVERLAHDVRGPLLVVATARPDLANARLGWGSGRYEAQTIRLDPLPGAGATELVESLLGSGVPPSLQPVLERAEGNPLFLEETLATLIDRGVLEAEREDGRWTLHELPAGFGLPDSVQALVAARIDLLEPAEKSALQAGAVMGRVFWTGPVYDLVDGEPDWRLLEERDFVRRRPASSLEGEPEYAFKHATIRDVAYESVPRARRARLHAAVAEWLERRIGGRDEVASLLAHHYAAAVRPGDADLAWRSDAERHEDLRGKAIAWLRRAGDLAMGRYEVPDAVALFTQALELEPEREEQIELWRSIGRGGAFMYDGQLMWDAMRRAIDLTTDPKRLGKLYAELALDTTSRAGMWPRAPDHDLVMGWIDRALELVEPDSAARARALIAMCYWLDAKPGWAVEEAERLTRDMGDPALRQDALCALWLREFSEGHYRRAVEVAREAFELENETTDPTALAARRETSVALFTLSGHLDEARRLVDEHDALSLRLFPHQRVHAVAMHVELQEVLGEWEAIRSLVPRTRAAVAENLDTPCIRNSRTMLACAAACAALGEEILAAELEAEAERMRFEGWDIILDTPRLRLALARGDLETARRLAVPPLSHRRQVWFYPGAVAAYFDAVAALGDRTAMEEAAEALHDREDSVLTAFALRAQGILEGDRALLGRAAERFDSFGFGRQADATRAMATAAP
jgi:class 3 adenylate cyclase